MGLTEQLATALAEVPRTASAPPAFADSAALPSSNDLKELLRPVSRSRFAIERVGYAVNPESLEEDGSTAPEQGPLALAAAAPVLQLSPLPVTLNPADFANPISDSNPGGSYATAAAFQRLTDPVPGFSRYYSPSSTSTERFYGRVVAGASSRGFSQQLFLDAQKDFTNCAYSDMGGVPGTWRRVDATPGDWYDLSQAGRYKQITLDMSGGVPSVPGFTTLAGSDNAEELAWIYGEPGKTTVQPLDAATKIRQISFQGLRVDLSRRWLSFEIFRTRGWSLEGQNAGYVSSGNVESNSGVMPLIATGLIIARDVTVTADWSTADQEVLRKLATLSQWFGLGPFALFGGAGFPRPTLMDENTIKATSLQVIGWISELVPFSPTTDG